ncbi:MAG: hypothetical protein WA210_00460, partial [Burkholderiaceae bacterium]
FYIARYGLLLTAKHVVDDIAQHDAESRPTLAWLWGTDGTLRFRPMLTCSFDSRAPREAADIAICQVVDKAGEGEVRLLHPNERIALVTTLPPPRTRIATYAYPSNHRVDFAAPERTGTLFADAFEGEVIELIGPKDGFLRYPHMQTSIDVGFGASGGPVFGPGGHAFAVNCRGWELQDAEPLSSVVPVSQILDLQFPYPYIPTGSAEESAVPRNRRGGHVTLRELAAWGHVSVDP